MTSLAELTKPITDRTATVAVIGMGYVGVPLAEGILKAGFPVIGLDVDAKKVNHLNAGESYLKHIDSSRIGAMRATQKFSASADFAALKNAQVILICVPTPLGSDNGPVLDYVEAAGRSIAKNLQKGQLVILESSSYPGTTGKVLKPILEASGLKSGTDFYLSFSPEREDPGNATYGTTSIPKIVSGDGDDALAYSDAFYKQFIVTTVPVATMEIAEAAKLLENTFRSVNIALINEVKTVLDAMDIDVWQVVDAAKTKPFGFMPFYPGPGVGGHCIPVDPLYLTWVAHQHGARTHFIDLAQKTNLQMPIYILDKLEEALGSKLAGKKVLLLGVAYKKNIDDYRESSAIRMADMVVWRGGTVSYYDPNVPTVGSDHTGALEGKSSIAWDKKALAKYDAAIIVTDHDTVNYQELVDSCPLVIDSRNVTAKLKPSKAKIVKA
jgi:UDP-N-acetyl-D-glucosamine dehydrogenase